MHGLVKSADSKLIFSAAREHKNRVHVQGPMHDTRPMKLAQALGQLKHDAFDLRLAKKSHQIELRSASAALAHQ